MQRVLFVGQEREATEALRRGLDASGYHTAACLPGREEPALVGEEPADVLVVDLTSAGEEPSLRRLWQEARRDDLPPTIVLLDEAQLLHSELPPGTDDFLVLPASAAELAARIRQTLRRRLPLASDDVLRCGPLTIDLANYKAFVGSKPVNLTYKEFQLLRLLASNADKVFTRETLLNQVWGYDFYGGARTVDVHIRRLRSKIEDSHHTYIETVRNVGYRFRTRS